MNGATEPLLKKQTLTKQYGSVTVLSECDLQFRAGEIHALLGANGAGKSTLAKIIAGLVSPTSGSMTLNGQPYAPATKHVAELAGVEIVQQELNFIPTLSIAENLMLNRLPALGGIIRQASLHDQANRALERIGLEDIETTTLVSSLGVGRQQMVEIAAALDRDCRLLILDEPTAALSAVESTMLFEQLRQLREQGVGMVYISHRLEEVMMLADRVTVLRDGTPAGTAETQQLSTDEIVRLMSGEQAVTHSSEYRSRMTDTVAMRVDSISCGVIRDVSFTVHQGERLGISGLVGAGRTELLRAIFGADPAESGSVSMGEDPESRRFTHPAAAVAAGLAMVTEDRKHNGLLLSQSIRMNTTLNTLIKLFANWGIIRPDAEVQSTRTICQSLETRCSSIEQTVETLSGGNQQKVALAKWLLCDPDVLLLDEPTRGIDIAARQRIYRLMESLANDGKGIVIVSSDLEELMETCDRIAVMSNGQLVETFGRDDWSRDRIMQAAFAGYCTVGEAAVS